MSEQSNTKSSRRNALADSIFGGALSIGIGIVWWQGYWWPGLATAIGVASALAALIRGSYLLASILLFGFVVVPNVYYYWPDFEVPWSSVGPIALIGLGALTLVTGLARFIRK
ncbi:hypothetical protein [Salinibius halmophilus]|uniref:hypothetical protein n=1 Tax=Salinibius halmophilus TaxID=1853216 RepID=UPI000E6621D9|nr:hypothetical protein [Salinibius halmophilus]